MTQQDMAPASQPRPSRSARARFAVVLALLVAAPLLGTPETAAAAAPRSEGGTQRVSMAVRKTTDVAEPSIQYQQAVEHEADVVDFVPGDRVDVPFSPRKGDAWVVDGQAPRSLPAGRATGLEMRGDAKADHGPARPADDAATPDPTPTGDDTTVVPASYVAPGSAGELTGGAAVSSSGLRREVFGFLPYWELGDSSTVLDWRTLSTVAYFSVGCTSTGGLDKTNPNGSLTSGWAGWTSSKMSSVLTAAHQNHARVVLSITCFAWTGSGASRQAALLGSATARSNFARAAAAAVRDRGADGINLDFEPIVAGYAEEFTALVRSIRSELNKVSAGYQLTFCTLGSIGNQPIAEATAPGGADAVFVMGYDYRTDSSSAAGSISPLTGPKYDLTDTIKAYTAKISASKVILGVPYYGRAWSTGSDKLNATTLSGAKYGYAATPTYGDAVAIAADHGRRWDSVEQAPWTAYRKQTCTSTYGCVTSWRELYYDDATSLKLRYDLVNRTGLRGAGIWALGFDGTRAELRNALADKFLADRTPPVVGIVTLAQQQRDEGFRVAWTSWDDSTIKGYDVQVSGDGSAWVSWLTATTLTSSIYLGTNGRTYAFRVRATDVHGNVSAWNALSTTATGIPSAVTPGGFATVLADGLRMRSSPSTAASIMATLSAGDALQVIAGPIAGEGYSWFQVAGPVTQWAPVDAMQVGGWVAASGNGATNVAPRRAVYATRADAGITGLRLNGGGDRVLTPNGDGVQDVLRLGWTNHRAFDSLALRVYRLDGTLAGSVALGGTSSGAHTYDWSGRIGGVKVPDGAYVLQLQGSDGGTTFSAPSASPVSPAQIARFGIVVGPAAPTSVAGFGSTPKSPTNAKSLTFGLHFGGPIAGLSAGDIVRSGTAANCAVGAPVGAGASWSITVTGCSQGTVKLGLKADSVVDAVGNLGPNVQATTTVVIDRTAPVATTPKATLRPAVSLASISLWTGLLASVGWGGTDAGGAGIGTWDLQRSVDGGTYTTIAAGVPSANLAMSLAPDHTYRFRVRARDRAGNVGSWVTGATITPLLRQQTSTTITWKGSWATSSGDHYSGGSARRATAAGASASYTFTGRSVAWVSTFAPDRGSAKVYVDGVLVTTVSTYATTTLYRRIAFAKSWSVSGYHTLRIVVVGTAGHPLVDLDALEVLR